MNIEVKVSFSGLCGSDIHRLNGDSSIDYKELGHEISGTVLTTTNNFKMGDKVVILPIFYDESNQQHYPSNILGGIGKTEIGGFSGTVVVPEENAYKLAPTASLESYAITDVVACAVHAFNLAKCPEFKKVLIIGDGAIGLCCMMMFSKANNHIGVIGKHNRELVSNYGYDFYDASSPPIKKDQFDVVIEAVGRNQSASMNLASYLVKPRGTIVVEGVFQEGFFGSINLRSFFIKECSIQGANSYTRSEFEEAIEILQKNRLPFGKLITHKFPIEEFDKGLELMKNKNHNVIKIVYTH